MKIRGWWRKRRAWVRRFRCEEALPFLRVREIWRFHPGWREEAVEVGMKTIERGNDRPHPQERGDRSAVAHVLCIAGYWTGSGLNEVMAEIEMITRRFSNSAPKLSLSLGEREGVRADTNRLFSTIENRVNERPPSPRPSPSGEGE